MYAYDSFGRRLWKDENGTKTYFFYADEGLADSGSDSSPTSPKTPRCPVARRGATPPSGRPTSAFGDRVPRLLIAREIPHFRPIRERARTKKHVISQSISIAPGRWADEFLSCSGLTTSHAPSKIQETIHPMPLIFQQLIRVFSQCCCHV